MAVARKKRPGPEPKPSQGSRKTKAKAAVRRLDDPLDEWRFEPRATPKAVIAMVLLSLGGVALGAGVFGQWFRAEQLGASRYAPWLMVAGVLMVGGFVLLGRNMPEVLRVGDLGVGIEHGRGNIERTAWYELGAVRLAGRLLTVEAQGRTLLLSLDEHPHAIRRLLGEAARRIPKKLRARVQDRTEIGAPGADEGLLVDVDPPQVAGRSCMNSGKELTFEHDTRRCARCGALYDKSSVPPTCKGCDATLRA